MFTIFQNYLNYRFYIAGIHQVIIPRYIRRLFAKTLLQRAWLNGLLGLYIEDGVRFGICNRDRYRNKF
jgi:hypothetical protein